MTDELTQLQAEAAAIDAEAAPATIEAQPPETQTPAGVDPVESLAGFLSVLGIAAGYAGLPRTATIWQPGTCRGLADKAVPVLVKYPWGQRLLNFLATGAGVEEMALAAFAAPLVLATHAAIREDLKPARPEPVQTPPAA